MTLATNEPWVPTQTFGTRLLLVRRELGVTVKEAATKCGIHYATWSTWENGSKPSDMVRVVDDISTGLGVDRQWLMWGQPGSAPQGPGGGGAPSADTPNSPDSQGPPTSS
jgi:transcriptional regulator with XRE-family HTH domain